MREKGTVLVTGSAGRIGQAVVAELTRRGWPVRGFDRAPTSGTPDAIVGDLTDRAALDRAARGVQTVIHLAATPDDDDFLTQLLPNNVVGVYHVFEAARAAGVRRLILASSGQVVWWQRATGPWPIGVDAPPTPRYWYAATKLFLEAGGRAYADTHGISVIAARLGWCPRTPEQVEEIRACDWGRDVYLSPGDAGRFFACAVEADLESRFIIVYATSKPTGINRYDLDVAKRLLGYVPMESWPQGIEVVLSP